jgi:hypothetical protein
MIKESIRLARRSLREIAGRGETAVLLAGKQMAWQVAAMPANTDFRKVGFKVFSQFDEDGIIQYLINVLPIGGKTFIEFGVENYRESNTRFLLLNNHWQGMVLEGRASDIRSIQRDKMYWQYDLQVRHAWITRDNINELLLGAGFGDDVGLLSIDIDGNDYWIWEAVDGIRPRIVIVEYNSVFGLSPIAVPYAPDFQRSAAHYSHLYYGASLGALECLAKRKGYLLVGSNAWGHNAFFVRKDIAGDFHGLDLKEAYVPSKFRESRNRWGRLSYLRGPERLKLIEEMPVIQIGSGQTRQLKEVWEAP